MRKVAILVVVGVLLVAAFAANTSFSFMVNDDGQGVDIEDASCFTSEVSKDNIVVNGNGDTELDTYTLKVMNTCSTDVKFTVNFEVLEDSTLEQKDVLLAVDGNNPKYLSAYTGANVSLDGSLGARELESGWINPGTDVTYTIKVGLVETLNNDKVLNGKIVVSKTN